MVKLKDGDNTFDIQDISTVNDQEAQRDPNGIYLNFDNQAIPDLNKLTTEIINFLEYVNTDEAEKIEKDNFENYKRHLEGKFPDFTLNYINIYNMLLEKENREDNLVKLLNLFEILKDIKEGKKDIQEEFIRFKEAQASEYIYPKYGGKENFEKHIKQRALKKQKKTNRNN